MATFRMSVIEINSPAVKHGFAEHELRIVTWFEGIPLSLSEDTKSARTCLRATASLGATTYALAIASAVFRNVKVEFTKVQHEVAIYIAGIMRATTTPMNSTKAFPLSDFTKDSFHPLRVQYEKP